MTMSPADYSTANSNVGATGYMQQVAGLPQSHGPDIAGNTDNAIAFDVNKVASCVGGRRRRRRSSSIRKSGRKTRKNGDKRKGGSKSRKNGDKRKGGEKRRKSRKSRK